MTQVGETGEVATDAQEVHELLTESDRWQAQRTSSPVPVRSFATTRRRVRERAVHVVRIDGLLVGMVTLSWDPPFMAAMDGLPTAARPAYLSRLAVAPDRLGDMVGLRCLRAAVDAAALAGADAVRAEANPDLAATCDLLRLLGFVQYGPVEDRTGMRSIQLQKNLR